MSNFLEDYNKYKELIAQYENEIYSEKYFLIIGDMPLKFLNAVQLCDQLDIINKVNSTSIHRTFNNADEAYDFYYNIVIFKKNINELIDNAKYIISIKYLINTINDFVNQSNYLNNTFCIVNPDNIDDLAQEVIDKLPNYPKLLSANYRINFIESCIISLQKEELEKLCQRKVILPTDIEKISLTQNIDKINFICDYYNLPHIIKDEITFSLKGTSFNNTDGSSRQEYLKELKEYKDKNPDNIIELGTKPFKFHNQQTDNDENAILYTWNNKGIGCAPREIAIEIYNKYKNPQFCTYLDNLKGGIYDNSLLGCNIKTDIFATEYLNNKELENEKEEI